MRTLAEVNYAFTPVTNLDAIQKAKLLKTELAFRELAQQIVDLVPESADRTAALRNVLLAKFTCVQAITHDNPATKEQKPNAKHQEENGKKEGNVTKSS